MLILSAWGGERFRQPPLSVRTGYYKQVQKRGTGDFWRP